MLAFQRQIRFFRIVSIITLLGFAPSSISLWNFTNYAAADPPVKHEDPWAKLPWQTADSGDTARFLPWQLNSGRHSDQHK